MTAEIQIELSMLVYAFGLGAVMRLVYGGMEMLRRLAFRGKIRSACLDIFYWILSAGAVYGLMYRYASGTLRGIILVFSLLGLTVMTAIDKKIAKTLKKRVKNG